jgi:glycosidase
MRGHFFEEDNTMIRFLCRALLCACVFALVSTYARAQDFKKQVIYQIVTDRFYDGNTGNDNCSRGAGLYDSTKANWNLYWGGDLAGIQAKLSYLQGMGITAIWISPPVENIDVNIPDSNGKPTAPYHGYSADDYMKIDNFFGDCSETWTAFDNLVSAAHKLGIKIVVDFPANDTNQQDAGEYGSLYNNGTFMAACNNDPNGYFHHNPGISNFEDLYQLQYYTLEDLCDLNQENSTIDGYLKQSLQQFQQNGTDAFRMDAVKHTTWGWEYSEANSIFTNAPSFVFGEWYETTSDSLYADSVKFANKSGMPLYDYPLGLALRDVLGNGNSFTEVDSTLSTENSNFTWPNDLVDWVDNQDQPRLLSMNNDNNRLNEALAFVLTARGIPTIYYGDEQYLHNDTSGGGTPYNRLWMSSFSTSTTAYQLISKLSSLRTGTNDALAYGTQTQRWMNSDVYIYERQFFGDVVLVAMNKNTSQGYSITGLNTALPAGNYSDYLGGLLSGFGITVTSGSGGNDPVQNFTLPAHTVAVWVASSTPTAPEVGSIGPTVGQAGMQVTIAGKNFGSSNGSVLFGSTGATINSWSNASVTFTVPNVSNGVYQVQLKNSSGQAANSIQFTVLTAKLIPVTFTVNNANPTNTGDYIYLTGSTVELGDWGTTFSTAVGPMLDPNYPNWFLNVSAPACQNIQFKFIDIQATGNVVWENGSNHTYTVPCSGTGSVNVNWQY